MPRQVTLPLSIPVIKGEVEGCHYILEKWRHKVPAFPLGDEAALEDELRQFVGELALVARRCEALADLLTSGL